MNKIKSFLNKIREPQDNNISVIKTISIFILGIVLGLLAKWLDNLSINDSIWWQHLIGITDLGNILSEMGIWLLIALIISIFSTSPLKASLNAFLFFLGMTASYHLYTIIFIGFNPQSYMLIWYALTFLSPLLAFICWYSKSNNKISILLSGIIIAVLFYFTFSIGFWYFDIKSIIDTIIFLIAVIVLYKEPKNTIYSLLLGIIIAYLFRLVY